MAWSNAIPCLGRAMSSGGTRQQPPAEEHDRFTDLLVIESAGHGISDTVPRQMECFQPDGKAAGMTSVVVVLAIANYLSKILYESTPLDVETVN
eukprot:587844-Amphidinium_carterae.1